MKTRTWAAIFSVCAGFCAFAPSGVRADDFKLKDGTKITGTIVGFENGTFTVQTSYGYALVDKDKIAEIIPSSTAAATKQKDLKAADKNPKSAESAAANNPPNLEAGAAKAEQTSAAPEKSAVANPKDAKPNQPAKGAASNPTPSAAPNSETAKSAVAPAPPPAPEPMHESVEGTQYVNQTFGFSLYKPPSWELIPDARSVLESAVAALGTFDETTLMVIAREPLQGTLEKHAEATQRRVSGAYENFRITGTRSGTVAGSASNERHYRGVIDGHDWSGVIVTFARGNDVFTILGATRAETDLVQIQENVIAR
ncbi:MAG TPA: hypothetical protein VFO34_18390, partial [Candidatus Acidoferrales bacterium]|nr:hypothetical protein [Candidatus Acidoferrales bacterium]